jgi:hypothetical protein
MNAVELLLSLSDILLSFPLFGSTLVSVGEKDFGLYSMSDVKGSDTITKSYGTETNDSVTSPFDPTKYIPNFYTLRVIFLTGYVLSIATSVLFQLNPSYIFNYIFLIITGLTNLVAAILLITGIQNSNENVSYSVWLYIQIVMSLLIMASGFGIKFNKRA